MYKRIYIYNVYNVYNDIYNAYMKYILKQLNYKTKLKKYKNIICTYILPL